MIPRSAWRRLLSWYRKEGRDLPWRVFPGSGRRVTDYQVAVSEFMLQQTRVDRVLPLFLAFIGRYPTWRALAEAPQADVVRAWKGLGYNMRAVRLRELARAVVEEHGGALPASLEALLALKGIGPYTARAIRVFAFHRPHLAPDTNIRRVITRLTAGPSEKPASFSSGRTKTTHIWESLEHAVPAGIAYDLNQALMDLGAAVCTARAPRCPECPLRTVCRSYPGILSLRRPPGRKAARTERTDERGLPDRIYRGRIVDLLRQRPRRLTELGPLIKEGFSAKDRAWLLAIVARLEKDGLVAAAGARLRLA